MSNTTIPERPPVDTDEFLNELCNVIRDQHPELKTCRPAASFDVSEPDIALGSSACPSVLIVPREVKYGVDVAGLLRTQARMFDIHIVVNGSQAAYSAESLARDIASYLVDQAYLHARWHAESVEKITFDNPLLDGRTLSMSLLETALI